VQVRYMGRHVSERKLQEGLWYALDTEFWGLSKMGVDVGLWCAETSRPWEVMVVAEVWGGILKECGSGRCLLYKQGKVAIPPLTKVWGTGRTREWY
jgi:hypothetical protein